MLVQLLWLKELLNKKPTKFEEYFYFDIQNYLDLNFENENKEINKITDACGKYAEELLSCNSKKEVKLWLDYIILYITLNLDTDFLIDSCFYYIKNGIVKNVIIEKKE